jgi:2-dehydro-3-deoxygalactonokinase
MTGEVYAVLRQHSILARTLPAGDPLLDEDAFVQGVRHAKASGSLLHATFSARTLSLFDRMPATALASYLSGLVIGEELRGQPALPSRVVLIGSDTLTRRYELALREVGVDHRSVGSAATWRGLWALAANLESA